MDKVLTKNLERLRIIGSLEYYRTPNARANKLVINGGEEQELESFRIVIRDPESLKITVFYTTTLDNTFEQEMPFMLEWFSENDSELVLRAEGFEVRMIWMKEDDGVEE